MKSKTKQKPREAPKRRSVRIDRGIVIRTGVVFGIDKKDLLLIDGHDVTKHVTAVHIHETRVGDLQRVSVEFSGPITMFGIPAKRVGLAAITRKLNDATKMRDRVRTHK